MARISTYAVSSPAEPTDELLGSDINKATKNFTVGSILDLVGGEGTDNTLTMFGAGSSLVDSPVSIAEGDVLNLSSISHIDLGYNTYYNRNLKISGEDSASQGHSFDGVQVTGELIVAKENNLPGDLAVYFRSDDTKLGGMVLDDDATQYGLYFYVSSSATELNPNIVQKISLAEGTTIGVGLVSTVPPENGLQVQGNINADSDLTVRGATALNAAQASTPATGDDSNNVATTAFVKASIDEIPSGLTYQGSWDADNNVPDLTTITAENAQYWIVSVEGDTDLDGETDWVVGDWAIYSDDGVSTGWQKIDNTSVLSGYGTTGNVTMFSGPNTLGDSRIRQIGGSVFVADVDDNDILEVRDFKVQSNASLHISEYPASDSKMILKTGEGSCAINTEGGNNFRVELDGGIVMRTDLQRNLYVNNDFDVTGDVVIGGGINVTGFSQLGYYLRLGASNTPANQLGGISIGSSISLRNETAHAQLNIGNNKPLRVGVGGSDRLLIGSEGTVTIAAIPTGQNAPALDARGAIKFGNSYAFNSGGPSTEVPTADMAGTVIYKEGANVSQLFQVMKTEINPDVYEWIPIKTINYVDNGMPGTTAKNYGETQWMTTDYQGTTYRDGTPIPQITDNIEWYTATTGAWCYMDNDPTKQILYNWYAVNGIYSNEEGADQKEFAPEGWKVPKAYAWDQLLRFLGDNYSIGGNRYKIAKAMASQSSWGSSFATDVPGNNPEDNNSSGFNIPATGYRTSYNGNFVSEGYQAGYWAKSASGEYGDACRLYNYSYSVSTHYRDRKYGYSVRLIKE